MEVLGENCNFSQEKVPKLRTLRNTGLSARSRTSRLDKFLLCGADVLNPFSLCLQAKKNEHPGGGRARLPRGGLWWAGVGCVDPAQKSVLSGSLHRS